MPHVVMNHFKCTDAISQVWQCLLCDKKMSGGSLRHRMEHLLGQGTAVKACPERQQLKEDDGARGGLRRRRAVKQTQPGRTYSQLAAAVLKMAHRLEGESKCDRRAPGL